MPAGWAELAAGVAAALVLAAAAVKAVPVLWNASPVRWVRVKIFAPIGAEAVRQVVEPHLVEVRAEVAALKAGQQEVAATVAHLVEVVERELNHNGGSSFKDEAVAAARALDPGRLGDEPSVRDAVTVTVERAQQLEQQREWDRLGREQVIDRSGRDDEP